MNEYTRHHNSAAPDGPEKLAHGASHGMTDHSNIRPSPRPLAGEGGRHRSGVGEGIVDCERVYNQIFDGLAEKSGPCPE
jgi:hypothetical protein